MRFYISAMFLLFSIICTGQPTDDGKNYTKVALAFYNSSGQLLQLTETEKAGIRCDDTMNSKAYRISAHEMENVPFV